jgi:ferritin-like metal-binding protein YciE
MQAENLSGLFERGLEFAWDCEHKLSEELPKMAEAATFGPLRENFLEHLIETKAQIDRLRRVFEILDRAPAAVTSEPARGLAGEAAKLIHHIEASPLRDAALIFTANQLEHYEIALYGSLTAFARVLGREEAESLLTATLEEEKAADRKLSTLAETSVYPEAANHHNAAPFAFI